MKRVEDRMLVCMSIFRHMEEMHITQTELAARMGKSKSEVSEWLSGERNFTMDTLSDMCSALDIPITNILTANVRMSPYAYSCNVLSSQGAFYSFANESENAYTLTA